MKKSTIRKKEKRLLELIKQAIEHTDEAIMITDAKLKYPGPKVVYVNPALCDMTGYTKDELLGKSPRILQGPRTNRILLEFAGKKLIKGEMFHGEIVNYRKDGSEIHINLDIAPIRGEKDKVTHYISIHRDITSSIKEQLEKDELLGAFNHDLKSLLSTVKGYMQLMGKKCSDLKIREYVINSEKEVDKIALLLSKLQKSTNVAASTMARIENVDIDALINQTIKNVKSLYKSHKLSRRGKVYEHLDIDANKVSQVIEHLISSAIKYSPDTKKIVIRATKNNKHVIINIEDPGKGLNTEEQERIFQSFYMLHDANGQASQIVREHGGTIDVRSTVGKGATFSFTLPIKNIKALPHQQLRN